MSYVLFVFRLTVTVPILEASPFAFVSGLNLPFVTVGLFDIKDKHQACHYGVVSIDKKNRIVKLCEKPSRPKSSLVAMCLYYFPQGKLRLIKRYLENSSNSHDTTGSYIDWLSRKDKVYGFVFKNLWFDIGHLHTYKKVENLLKEGR